MAINTANPGGTIPEPGNQNNTQAKPVAPNAPPVRRQGGPQQSTRQV